MIKIKSKVINKYNNLANEYVGKVNEPKKDSNNNIQKNKIEIKTLECKELVTIVKQQTGTYKSRIISSRNRNYNNTIRTIENKGQNEEK